MHAPLVGSTQGRDLFDVAAGSFHYRVTEYPDGLALPRHRHEHAKMSTAIRGTYTETYAAGQFDCDGRTLLMKPPDVSHMDRYHGTESVVLTVDLEPEALEMVRSVSPLFGSPRELRFRSPLIARMLQELERPDVVSGLALEALALELIAEVTRRDEPRLDSAAVFRRACEYLDAHLGQPLRIADLARAARIHPAQLTRSFRAHADCSPAGWIRARRIEVARQLLADAELPIAEIALRLGFFDQSHFSNTFRRFVGVSPARFRREHGLPGRPVVRLSDGI